MVTSASLALGKLGRLVTLPLVSVLGLSFAAPAFALPAVSSTLVEFTAIPVGATSAAQQVTLTNSQATPLTIGGITVSGHFGISANTCPIAPATLAANASCSVSVTFSPVETGLAGGALTFTDNAGNSPTVVELFGAGSTGGATSVSTAALSFGNVGLNQPSAAQTVTLTNNSGSALTVSNVTVPAHYNVSSNGCTGSIAPTASCNISVTFTPVALGGLSGPMFITDTADANPVELYVYGTGVAPVVVTPNPLAFGNVPVGVQTIQFLTITNNLSTGLTAGASTITGAGFSIVLPSTTCPLPPNSLAPGASCQLAVGVNPSTAGSHTGTLHLVNNASTSPQIVNLSATGIVSGTLTASPTSLAFGNAAIDAQSAPQTVLLQNTTGAALAIGPFSTTAGSPFVIDPTSPCLQGVSPLSAGQGCNIRVFLDPTVLGAASGNLTIAYGTAGSVLTVPLSGTAVTGLTLSPSSLAFGSVPVNSSSAGQSFTITNHFSGSLPYNLAFSAPFVVSSVSGSSSCQVGGALSTGASCVWSIVFSPTVTGPANGTATLTVTGSPTPAVTTATMTGTGTVATTLSAGSLAFGNVLVGTTSAAQSVTFSNLQSVAVHFSTISVPAPYAIAAGTTCSTTAALAPNASCNIAVTLSPMVAGPVGPSSVTIADDAPTSPQAVRLTGAGLAAVTITPNPINFGQISTQTLVSQAVTVTNNMATTLHFTGGGLTGTGYSTTANTCGASLAPGASCGFTVDLTAPTPGSYPGSFSFTDNAPGSPQVVTLSATAVSTGATVSPTALNFGNVAVGTTSALQSVTLTNNTASAITLSSVGITAGVPFALGASTCGASLAGNASCTIGVKASPTAAGPANATLTITDSASNSPQTVTLSVTGTAPLTPTPNPLAFGQVVTTIQTVQNVTLTNTTGVAVTLSAPAITGSGYTIIGGSTTCGSSLAIGASCVYAIGLTPPTPGSYPGSLTITDNAAGSPQIVPLSATAVPAVVVSPTSLTFAAQLQGTTSAAQSVTLTNNQAVPLNITSATFTGADPTDFNVGGSCPTAPASLPATSSCTFTVTFTPITTGTRTANLVINDSAATSPTQTITLTGAGNAPLTMTPPTALNYSAPVGSSSTFVQFTVTNTNGGAPVHISSFQTTGDFSVTATSCPMAPAALLAAANCVVTVNFVPTIAGTRGGQLIIYDDTAASPQVVNLQGIGTNPLTLSTGALVFPATKINTSSTGLNVTLTNHESQSETFSIGVTGPFSETNNCPTGVIAAQSNCIITVIFSPLVSGPNSGNITVTHSAANGSPLSLGLSGSGITTNPPGAVSVVSPGAGSIPSNVNVTITGNGWTNFSSASVINFLTQGTQNPCQGVTATVPNTATTTANIINAQIAIAADAVPGGCDISVVTGSETDFLSNAFIVADPTNSHIITNVAPNFGTQGQTLNVDLTATGTSFQNGITYANFGSGIAVNSLTVSSPTTAQANITISNTSYVGYNSITLVTGGEVAVSGSQAFQILPNNATLVSVTPNTAPQGGSLAVNLVATGTHFLQGATDVAFTGGINVGNVQVTSPTTATANIAVTPGATVGLQNVTVNTGGEIATLGNAFTVTGATPYLSSVTPGTGAQSQNLTLNFTGVFTSFATGQVLVDLGGDIQTTGYTVTSTTSMSANISVTLDAVVGGRTGYLTVGPSGNQTIYPFNFTVTPSSAQIISVTPNTAGQGQQLTLTVVGANTHWVQGTTQAAFVPIPVGYIGVPVTTIIDNTHAMLNIAVSSDHPVGPHSFYMATGGEVVYSSISVYAQTPTLNVSPANGIQGTAFSVSFTGAFTHFDNTTLPVVSGQGVTLSSFVVTSPNSATGRINITTTAPFGLRTITFTTGGEIVNTYFNVTNNSAYLYSIAPNGSIQNNTLNVAIVGVNTHFAAGTTVVNVDPFITVNSSAVTNATNLSANITVAPNAFIGWHTVYVNTGAEQVIIGFYVYGPQQPSIVSVSPGSAAQGATANVTITGSLTNWVQGTTEAILGAGVTVSNLQILSPTSATATISVSPTAPVGGNSVVMITGTEIESGAGFSVTPNSAIINSVQPVCASPTYANNIQGIVCNPPTGPPVISQLQTVTLAVSATGTHWLQGETTFSFGGNVSTDNLTITSQTTALVQITVLSGAPIGFASLTTTTDGEVVTLQQAIDIQQGFPILLSTTPGGALQGVTLNLQLLGQFTHWVQGVTSAAFNQDITVNSFTVIDNDNAVANITVSPLAFVDSSCSPSGHTITITTGSEQVSIPGSFCVGRGPAQITAVYPPNGAQGTTETVTVTGSATNWVNGITTANFGPGINVGNVTVTSPTTATVALAITQQAPTGYTTATMTTLGEIAQQVFAFQVTPNVATLNEAIPNQAEQGAPLAGQPTLNIHLIGQYSHFSALSTATFGAGITVNSVTFTDATDLTANITVDPLSFVGGRTVTVTTPQVPCNVLAAENIQCAPGATTGSEIVSAGIFNVIQGPAIITSVGPPNTGNQGQEVVYNITGSNTHWQQGITQFYIPGGGSDIAINSVVINSTTSATVDMTISNTAGTGTRSIYMVTAGESLVDSGAFVVTGGIPVITYLSPNNAQPGTSNLNVVIHGLYTQWDNTTTLSFGPGITINTFQVENSTTIDAVISIDPAAQNGYRTVFVQTGAQGLASNFQVYTPPPPVPYISYFVPSSGLPGQTFTVHFTGANTHWDPVNTTAEFGNNITVNTFQVLGPNSAIANITISPTAPASSNLITLDTVISGSPDEIVTTGFNIVVSVPQLVIVDPGSALQGANNVTVNIIGQYTVFDNTTTFNFGQGITVNNVTVLGPTIATANISIAQLAQLGGRSVTSTTQGVTIGGAGFSVTPSLALISAISPNTAQQGQSITVDVQGQNTHWSPATVFTFGDGITVTNVVVNSPTDATVTISIPPLAGEGVTGATAVTAGEVASINNGFVVQPGTPYLLSSGPSSVPQQGTVTFTILSQQTTWTTTPPTVSYGPGIVLTNTNVTGDTSLTVTGFAQPTTPVGYRNLTVTTGSQILTLPNAVYVSPGPAVINSISPATAGQGANIASLTINGTNTNWVQGTTTLTLPGVQINSLTIMSPILAVANVTVSDFTTPGIYPITMTTLGEVATKSNAFTVTQTQPQILFINPASVVQGATTTVTVTSVFTNFDSTTTATFGPGVTVNSVTPVSATSLQVNLTVQPTAALGYRNVSITTGSISQNVAATNLFQVTQGPAEIYSLSPNTGQQNGQYTVNIVGSQTNFAQGVTTASFGGGIQVTGLTVNGLLSATATITIPSSVAVGNYNVTLTTNGEVATILGGFSVTAGNPLISVVNPPTGSQGTTINVALTGLYTAWVNGTSVANFGAGITVNSLTVSDATDAVANVTISPTAATGSRTVTVTTSAQVASITGGFSVLAGVPALVSASPGTGTAGTTQNVVITGAFSSFAQATSSVSFGSGITVNFITVSSPTQLTANVTIATNATVGNRTVNVTTGSQNLNLNNGFMVLPGTPAVTVINPNIGTPNAALTVTISGQYTNWMNGTTVVNFGPGISVGGAALGSNGLVTVGGTGTLTASLTIDPAAALGPRTVTITTNSEVEMVAAGFTVQATSISPPTIVSLSPGNSAGGLPINGIVTVVFSQPMNRSSFTTSNVLMYLVSNQAQGNIPITGTISVDASGRIMTFTPSALLPVNSQFYFNIAGSVKDASGNPFSNYATYLYTTFGAGISSPTVIAANPVVNNASVGTNVKVQLEFSADMNQSTQAGMTLSTGGTPVAGSYSWNSSPTCNCGPGTILTFTPAAPLSPTTLYTVAYTSALTDTAGNPLVAGSFNFTTAAGPDTATNSSGPYFNANQTLAINVAPRMNYAKPVNPLDIPSTLFLYNADSGKYLLGTVTVAPDGMSAVFTPAVALLPQTGYQFYQAGCGGCDMDGDTLSGSNTYFVTGTGSSTTQPLVATISPASSATAIPLNAQIVLHMSEPIDPTTISGLTVTPSGGSAIVGTATLASDQVTLTFVPTNTLLGNTTYTVQFSGYADLYGNAGVAYSSSFTTATSVAPLNVSTGFTAGGTLSTVDNTPDANWTVKVGSNPPVAAEVVGPGDTGWYSGWVANGPKSSWVALNPNSVTGNTFGTYSTTFNLTGYSLNNLCLVGFAGIDDNGSLAINGTLITGNISAISSLAQINVALTPSILNAGVNTLSLVWGSTDNSYEAFRLQATIQTCGSTETGGLSLVSASPTINSTNVPTNSTITLTFNNPLDPSTVSDTTLPVMIGWNSNAIIAGNWVVNGAQAIFTPNAPFPPSTQIYVGECGGPYDLAGDILGNTNCYNTQLVYFTTSSTATAPSAPFQVTAFSPGANATGIGLRAPVTATFNRSFNPGTINPNASTEDFNLYAGTGDFCNSYNRSSDNATLVFNCYALPSSTQMTALIGAGLQDMAGNAVAPFRSSFTTAPYDSNSRGSIISTRPANGATGIGVNSPIVFYTNLPVNPATANGAVEVAQNNVALNGTVQVLDNGYTIVFTPSAPLTPGALIQWWITSSLVDTQYVQAFNATNGYFYEATSTATTAPAIQSASPALYNGLVPPNSIFDFQFNTPLDPTTVNSTNIYLYDSGTGLNVPATYSMPQPNEVLIVPTSNVSSNTYIYLYVKAGLHSSTSVPATATTPYFYTGVPVDNSVPTIVSAVPYNGAGNIGVNITPGVVFSKAIDPVSINSSTFQITNGGAPLAGTYMINNTDTRVSFVPNAPLPPSTSLVMSLNGVLDPEGHPVTFSSTFQTGPGPDFQQPTVLYTSIPNNGSVPVNATLTVTFSESMDITTFSPNTFHIYDYTLGQDIPATITWNSIQNVAYLTPTSPFGAGRQFNLYVVSGTDLAGNSMQNVSYTFYTTFTSASSAPTVTNINPISGSMGLGLNAVIEAQFSGAVDPTSTGSVTLAIGGTTVPTTVSMSAANTILQLVPATPLLANTTYTFTVAGVKDPAGNTVTTVADTFTTGANVDLLAATAINSNPPGSATVGTNVVPKLLFNKPLNPLTVNTATFRMYLYQTGQFVPTVITASPNGLEVTFQPLVPLVPGTEYYIQACCGFQDMDGNNGNGVNVFFYTGSGADTTAPTVTFNPGSGASGVPLNTQINVAINKPIDPTSWSQTSVQLHDSLNNLIAGTLTLPNPQTFVFVPTSNLNPSATYTISVSGFTDAMENPVAPVTSSFTTGTTAATPGLTFVSSNIPFGSTNVPSTQQIVLTFSQPLDPNTVNAATLKVMNGWNSNYPLGASYSVSSSGTQVTITPLSPWPAGASVYVGECGGPTDILGDVFQNGGCYGQQLVDFVVSTGTPDTTPLQVLSVNPANNATGVGINTQISVTFNKSINPGSVSANDAIIFAGQGAQDRGGLSISADAQTIYFNTGALAAGAAYNVTLTAGGITDASGNALASDFVSTFTTATYPLTGSGSVMATAPGSGATGVPQNSLLTLYLNRAVNPATLNGNFVVTVNGAVYPGTATATASNVEVQFTPTTPFPYGAIVQWSFSNVMDVYGDTFSANSGTFYMAAAPATSGAPQQISVSPICCNNQGLPTNTEIDVQYSLPIDSTTLAAGVNFNSGTTPASITLASPTLVRIVPSSPLSASTQYTLCTNANLKGTDGTSVQTSCNTTYFTTGTTGADTTPGTITVGPPSSSVNVGTNAYVRLVFSKPADQTTINSTTAAITSGGNPIPGVFSYVMSNNTVVGANFSPTNPLPPSSVIRIAVNGILDLAGNTFTPVTQQFTTAAAPVLGGPSVSYEFAGNTQNIGTNAIFTCRYTAPMDPSSFTAGNVYVNDYATNTKIPVTYTFSTDLMSVTLIPTSPLTPSTEYNYECFNAIDLTGNAQNNNGGPYFYTGGGAITTGPVLVWANPPSGVTNVALNDFSGPWNSSNLMLQFNEPLAENSIGNITLTPQGGSPLPIGTTLQDGDTIISVILPSALLPNTTYTYSVTGVTDYNGNPVTTATSSFTTGTSFDFTQPGVAAFVPANGATGVSDTAPGLKITFTEPMNPALFDSSHVYLRTHNTQTVVPTTFTISPDFMSVSLTPTSPLSAATIYDLVVNNPNWYLYDFAGNSLNVGSAVATFTSQ